MRWFGNRQPPDDKFTVIIDGDSTSIQVGDHLTQMNSYTSGGPADADQGGEWPDEPEEDPPVDDYDPGPEVDDRGGMSEYDHVWPDERWPEAGA